MTPTQLARECAERINNEAFDYNEHTQDLRFRGDKAMKIIEAAITTALDEQAAVAAGAGRDGERLDWLEKHGTVAAKYQHLPPASDHTGPVYWAINWQHKGREDSPTLRQAIDAARASEGQR